MKKQINVRIDDEVREAIDDIRRMSSPIPGVSEVIRQAVLNELARMRKRAPIEQGAAR